jgi:hypothetical protein
MSATRPKSGDLRVRLLPGRRTQTLTLADINRFARPTLAPDQEGELFQLVLVEVGDGPERHP